MKRKIIALCLVVAMLGVAVISGTMAYFTDTAEAVNVMTIGSVKIEQIEQQRDGSKLVEFKQGKELLPAVGGVAKYIDLAGKETDSYKSAYKFLATADLDPLPNAIDKIVTVKNTGRSDAYVRTIFGFEVVESAAELYGTDEDAKTIKFMRNDGANTDNNAATPGNSDWTWEWFDEVVTVNGQKYAIAVATHEAILAPKTETIPSLLQIYLKSKVEQEYAAKLGANYEVLTVSQGVQASGFASAETALDEAFGDVTVAKAAEWLGAIEIPTMVSTPEELEKALEAAGAANSGNSAITLVNDLDMTGVDWQPIYVDGYHGADIVTLDGQGHKITNLSAPLFHGGFAGGSGIIIKNLTIADSNIVSTHGTGSGAFIEYVDSMEVITLENCHLLNSSVKGSRTGGLVGYTTGYSNQNDGPVKTYVTVRNCSVISCEITGSSVGAINGHAGASDWTYTTIENCTVAGNTLTSFDDEGWRVGAVIGTANIGEVTIKNVTVGKNTMTQPSASSGTFYDTDELVGRFVPGSTGKLEISGTVVDEKTVYAASNADLAAAAAPGATIQLLPGTYEFPAIEEGMTIVGGDDVVFEDTLSGTLNNATFKDVHIKAGNAQRWAYAKGTLVFEGCTFDASSVYAIHYDGLTNANVTYKDCTIIGWVAIGGGAEHITFENCEIYGNGRYGVIRLYSPGTIKDCTFDVAAVNTTDVYQDGIHAVDCNIDVINVTNVNGTVDELFNVSGTGTITKK